jgi:succinyl-CoA synthetase beta subunit
MVNGAGLAMATMDIIKLTAASRRTSSTSAAARQEAVTNAFKILLSDPHVKGVLINIFGGIMKCDVIAEGVIAAAKEVELEGAAGRAPRRHQRREGPKRILREAETASHASSPPTHLDDAAKKIVAAIGRNPEREDP